MLQVQVDCPQPQEQLWPGVQFAQQPFFAQEQQPTSANARPTAAASIMTLFIFRFLSSAGPIPDGCPYYLKSAPEKCHSSVKFISEGPILGHLPPIAPMPWKIPAMPTAATSFTILPPSSNE